MAASAITIRSERVSQLPEQDSPAPDLQVRGRLRRIFEVPAYGLASLVSPTIVPSTTIQQWMQGCAQYAQTAEFVSFLTSDPRKAYEILNNSEINPNTIFQGKPLIQHAYDNKNAHVVALLLMKGATTPLTADNMLNSIIGWEIPEAAPGDGVTIVVAIINEFLRRNVTFSPLTVSKLFQFAIGQNNASLLSSFLADSRITITPDQATHFFSNIISRTGDEITSPLKAQILKALLLRGASITRAIRQGLRGTPLLSELRGLYQIALAGGSQDDSRFVAAFQICFTADTYSQLHSDSHSSTDAPTTLLPGDLGYTIPDNWFRDFFWTGLSALNANFNWQTMPPLDSTAPIYQQITSSSFVQPMATQWVYSTIPMIALGAYQTYQAYQKGEVSKEDLVKIWAPVAAASLAIPMWDLGQVVGTNLGSTLPSAQWYGSSIAGGLIAAPFTGIFEGFTQWGVRYLVDVATNPVTREMWRQKPALMAKVMTKELLLNVTIGAIPGAVWQIVYFFLLPALLASLPFTWAIILTMLAVAIAVMICNFICTHAINKASDYIDRNLGWYEEIRKLRELATRKLQAAAPSEFVPQRQVV